MRSIHIPEDEEQHLISWERTEDYPIGSLQDLYFNMRFSGCYTCRKSFVINRQKFESVLLLLTLEGEGKLHYQNNDYSLKPGSVMLLDTWNPHVYYALGDGWKFKYVHFCGGMSNQYLSYMNAQYGPVFPLHKRVSFESEEHLDAIFQETSAISAPDYPIVSSHIYSILMLFLSHKYSVSREQKSVATVHQAAAYIMANYDQNINTQEIADAVHLSRSYMSEIFTKTYGMAPHEYLIMYRLSRAKEYLRTSTLSVNEIAERTGFHDVFTLSRIFKQKFGISPTGYRKYLQE